MINHPVWSKSSLLKVMQGRLKDGLQELLRSRSIKKVKPLVNERIVYVLLYHQQGSVSVWEKKLRQIRGVVNSRPVFFTEQEAKSKIGDCEAIVRLKVSEQDVLDSDGIYCLKDGVINEESIIGFYWDGQNFVFNGQSLVQPYAWSG